MGQPLFLVFVNFNGPKFIEEDSLDSISSPSVKIQIIGGKVYLSFKGIKLLGVVNKLLKNKNKSPSNVLPYYLNQTFPPII